VLIGEADQIVHFGDKAKVKIVEISSPHGCLGGFHVLDISDLTRALVTHLCPMSRGIQSENGSVGDGLLKAALSAFETGHGTYFASEISSPASASDSLIASAPYFLVASLIVKKLPVLLLIFFPLSIRCPFVLMDFGQWCSGKIAA
jgi:hypothetical protein